jgi:hypothetical protein
VTDLMGEVTDLLEVSGWVVNYGYQLLSYMLFTRDTKWVCCGTIWAQILSVGPCIIEVKVRCASVVGDIQCEHICDKFWLWPCCSVRKLAVSVGFLVTGPA